MRLRKLPNWSEKDQEGGPSGPPSSHTRWYTFMPPRWYAFRLPFTDNVLQKQTPLLGIRRGGFLFPWDDLPPISIGEGALSVWFAILPFTDVLVPIGGGVGPLSVYRD